MRSFIRRPIILERDNWGPTISVNLTDCHAKILFHSACFFSPYSLQRSCVAYQSRSIPVSRKLPSAPKVRLR